MDTQHGLTRQLASFVVKPQFEAIPDAARLTIRNGFIDTAATMLAGSTEPVTGIVTAYVRSKHCALSEAHIVAGGGRAGAADAALINGTAAHALDYDDVALAGHPSTVLVPAVLAEAESVDASGDAAMQAYLIGYEVWAHLVGRERDTHHTKGWHPTGVFGTLGAAAAAAHLRGLDEATAGHALGIAASLAAGLTANFGTMTKPFHAGRAAANGIEAVRLAAAGMTASPDALEHAGGFLAAFSPAGNVDRAPATGAIGRPLAILGSGLSIKKYPMCYATHRVIDGVLDLLKDHAIEASEVEHIEATIGAAQAGMLRNHHPVNALEAKFSLEFAVASALVAHEVGLAQLDDAFVNQTAVKAAMRKVSIKTADTRCPIEPIFAFSDRVKLRLRRGGTLDSGDIRFARGNARLPLRDEELQSKFMDCARRAPHVDGAALYAGLMRLERVAHVADLMH